MKTEKDLEIIEEPDTVEAHDDADSLEAAPKPSEPQKGPKERLYDKIPLNAKQLDIIIWVLMVALVVVFALGVLVGNGII